VRRLNIIRSNLIEGLGIKVTIDRVTVGNNKNTSTTRIAKMPPLAPLSPPEQIRAQNQGENGGGISDGGDITSTKQQIPPPENTENHAQKSQSGASGASGCISVIPLWRTG
jgi:hypothetical protein